jgi:hypothetical protein
MIRTLKANEVPADAAPARKLNRVRWWSPLLGATKVCPCVFRNDVRSKPEIWLGARPMLPTVPATEVVAMADATSTAETDGNEIIDSLQIGSAEP